MVGVKSKSIVQLDSFNVQSIYIVIPYSSNKKEDKKKFGTYVDFKIPNKVCNHVMLRNTVTAYS